MRIPPSFKRIFELVAKDDAALKPTNVCGWIKSVRQLKTITFINIQDGTSLQDLTVVIKEKNLTFKPTAGQSVTIENAIIVKRKDQFETACQPSNLKLMGPVRDYPLQNKQTSLSTLRKLPEFKHRTTYLSNLLRFRHKVESIMCKSLDDIDFVKVTPPILTSIDCEGAGEMFKLNQTHWDRDVNLTVSSQLHLEVLMMGLGRVYCLQPCFRAEKSDTNRHLCEFWMLEAELAFVEGSDELIDLVEHMIKQVVKQLSPGKDLPKFYPVDCEKDSQLKWENLLKNWQRITYTEAIEILKRSNVQFQHPVEWGLDLKSEHEKWLCEHYGSPVFVKDYPRECKAFYMKINPDGKTVACFDLLFPQIGEITGGSIREDNIDSLRSEIERRGMDISSLTWYLNLRKDGSVPHGGFGIGIERLVSYLYGNPNIRDSIPFHRTTGHIDL